MNSDHALFTAAFVSVAALSYLLLRLGGLTFTRPSPAAVVVVYVFVTAYVGVWTLFFETSSRAVSRGVTDHDLVWTMFLMAAATLLGIAGGFALTPGRGRIALRPRLRALSWPATVTTLVLIGLCLAVLGLYLINLPSVPLFAALQGEAKEAVALRTAAGTSNYVRWGKPQYYHAFIRVLLPFLCWVLVAQAVIRRRFISAVIALIGIALAGFASVVDTSKGGLVGILLGCGLTYLALSVSRIKWRHVVIGLAVAFAASGVMVVAFMGTNVESPRTLAADLMERVFIGNLIPAYHVLDLFQTKAFLLGRTFPNPLGLLPFSSYDLDAEVWVRLNPSATGDRVYAAPSVLWAEMYANFGWAGVLVAAPVIGIFLKLLQTTVDGVRSDAVRAALIAFTSVYFMNLTYKGPAMLFGLPFDYYLLVVVFASTAIVLGDRTLRPRRAVRGTPHVLTEDPLAGAAGDRHGRPSGSLSRVG